MAQKIDSNALKKKILSDIRVELSDEFDKNFEGKAFFGSLWPGRKGPEGKGSLMMVTGRLRSSLRSQQIGEDSIQWTSDAPYADIHNRGGVITVTAKMKRFFWAKYYEIAPKIRHRKNKQMSERSQQLSEQANFYKSLALKKVGDKIVIPKRQFIGDSPEVRQIVQTLIDNNMKDLEQLIYNTLNPNKK
ncbi:MAG: phage virion morphogenesis protein [Dysgonamonadaceae bacterium]|jgi:phage gpG-like protein|nr:phage virion morphogenesis protein [Dysgonamonadaceae bacterium]